MTISNDTLRHALFSMQQQRDDLSRSITQIQQRLGVNARGSANGSPATPTPAGTTRKVSAESRRKMAEAQKRRYAALKTQPAAAGAGNAGGGNQPKAAKGKRTAAAAAGKG